jgi:AraC-like DNA-binding protein
VLFRSEEIIATVRAHLEETAGRGDTVESLARLAGYSKYHFLRLFKQHTGHTIHAYVDICRHAKMSTLEDQGLTRRRIAEELGFSSASAFLRWRRLRAGG